MNWSFLTVVVVRMKTNTCLKTFSLWEWLELTCDHEFSTPLQKNTLQGRLDKVPEVTYSKRLSVIEKNQVDKVDSIVHARPKRHESCIHATPRAAFLKVGVPVCQVSFFSNS